MFNRIVRISSRIVREWPGLARALYRAWRNPPCYPEVLQIEHTHRCNLKCVMCAHGTGTAPKLPDMEIADFVRVLDEFKGPHAAAGFDHLHHVHLQGIGEPFLHKQTLPMIREARARGLSTNFVTNMTVLTDELARELVGTGQELLMVSVDSIDAEVFADIRRGAKYDVLERVLENLARIQRAKAEAKAATPRVMVNSLLMKRTLHRAPELVARLSALGVERIYFNDVLTHGMDPEMRFSDGTRCVEESLSDMPVEEKVKALAAIKALQTPGCEIVVPEDWGGVTQRARKDMILTCADLWEKPYVTSEGYVTPCCYAPDKASLPMGNVREQRFEEIWFGPAYQQLRWQHLTGRLPGTCTKCSQLVERVAFTSLQEGAADRPAYTRVFMGRKPFSLGLRTALRAARFN
jgi:radical SAM protein with 4Fe4S-binding SPASM domain